MNGKDIIDNNYYGELDDVKIGKSMCEIESIWTDADGEINLHVDNIAFEGDILLKSLPDKEIAKVVKSVERALIQNGESNITLYNQSPPSRSKPSPP